MEYPALGASVEPLGLENPAVTSDSRFTPGNNGTQAIGKTAGGNIDQSGTRGVCKQYAEDFEQMLARI